MFIVIYIKICEGELKMYYVTGMGHLDLKITFFYCCLFFAKLQKILSLKQEEEEERNKIYIYIYNFRDYPPVKITHDSSNSIISQ